MFNFEAKNETMFIISLCISGMSGFFIVISINLNNTLNSPMSVAVTGEIKGIFGTILGLFLFGDVKITTNLVAGLFLSTIGSVMYSYIKLMEATINKIKAEENTGERKEMK